MKKQGKETILVDASSILFKYALVENKYELTTSEGVETTIVYSFMDCILNLCLKFNTNSIIVVFDSHTNNRKALYPSYKANRKEVPEEIKERRKRMYAQIPALRDFLQLSNIQYTEAEGFESDDIIASYIYNNPDTDFITVSTDHDMYQTLVGNNRLYNINKDQFFTEESFNKLFPNLPAKEYWRVLAIAGCTTDNVEGLKGIGEKTAYKYLTHSLRPESKAFNTIKSNKDTVYFTQKLVKLPLKGCPVFTLNATTPSITGFCEACEKYEFNSFLDVSFIKQLHLLFNKE